MPDLDAKIRARIEAFTEELTALVEEAAVERAVNALKGTSGSVKAGGRRPVTKSGSKTRPKGGRRSPEQIKKTLGNVLRFIKEHKGTRSENIRKELGLTATQTGDSLTRLLKAKSVKSTGKRRSTTYSAV